MEPARDCSPERAPEWPSFYAATADAGPHITTSLALSLGAIARSLGDPWALDLGCGAGRDAQALLAHGYRVVAVDADTAAITPLATSLDAETRARLHLVRSRFERFKPKRRFAIVNASLALPFCAPVAFPGLVSSVLEAVQIGGLFAGHFFGPNDGWVGTPGQTFLARAEVASLFEGFEVALFRETEVDGVDALGRPKHWHIFGVVARRREERSTSTRGRSTP